MFLKYRNTTYHLQKFLASNTEILLIIYKKFWLVHLNLKPPTKSITTYILTKKTYYYIAICKTASRFSFCPNQKHFLRQENLTIQATSMRWLHFFSTQIRTTITYIPSLFECPTNNFNDAKVSFPPVQSFEEKALELLFTLMFITPTFIPLHSKSVARKQNNYPRFSHNSPPS